MMPLFLTSAAWALCAVSQTPRAGGMDVRVEARAEPIGCRTVSVSSGSPVEVDARIETAEGRSRRVRADHRALLPGGGVVLAVPELRAGDTLHLSVTVPGDDLVITLGDVPPQPPRGTVVDEVRTFQLDARHPAWGFADPARGRTHVEARIRVSADVPAQLLPLPPDADLVDAGGLATPPHALLAGPGTDTVVRYTVPGAAPVGRAWLGPGSLVLRCPACAGLVGTATDGATVGAVAPDTLPFSAPAGGRASWRVERTADGTAVIPDAATWLAGLDWHFARVSLPEPAVPMRLKGMRDRRALLDALYAEVQALTAGALPGADPLRPRNLNRAWRSGWATSVERALVLHRMLGQEKIRVQWVLTGEDPDPRTFAGFDTMLLVADLEGQRIWLDPGCGACEAGQVSTRWMGRPAMGGDTEIPRAPGVLTRSVRVEGDRVEARFVAEGAAARWIRESLAGVDPAYREARLATLLGGRNARVQAAEGLDAEDGSVTVVVAGDAVPRDPFDGRPTPWAGGIVDTLDAAGDGAH